MKELNNLFTTIVVGKKNSKGKPCKFCDSTTYCDCSLDIISVGDFYCLNCGCSFGHMTKSSPQKCPNCGLEK